jgi:hypothetical protein
VHAPASFASERINRWCGSIDFELGSDGAILGTISRRDIADELRNIPNLDLPTDEDIRSFDDFMRGPPDDVDWGIDQNTDSTAQRGGILREHGIEPAPERDRHTRWSTFLQAHWECLTATDFLRVEVYTIKGLVTYNILFFIDIASRSVHIAGITPHPDNRWMKQIARNVTDAEDDFLRDTSSILFTGQYGHRGAC